jgi:hypothetical protein
MRLAPAERWRRKVKFHHKDTKVTKQGRIAMRPCRLFVQIGETQHIFSVFSVFSVVQAFAEMLTG